MTTHSPAATAVDTGFAYWRPELPAGEDDTAEHWSAHFDGMDPALSRGRFFRVSDELRTTCPVARSDRYEEGFWVLSDYDDIEQVHLDPETFSSYPVVCPSFGNLRPMIPIESDPPLHQSYRAVVSNFLSRKQQLAKEPHFRALAAAQLDTFVARGECDITKDFCLPFVLRVLTDMLGVPDEDLETMGDIGMRLVRLDASRGNPAEQLYGYFQKLVAYRREHPGDDLVSLITHSEIDGQPLSDNEILDYCMVILPAGFETTASSMSYAFLFLAERPDLADRLRADASLIPGAVEEIIRFATPVRALSRTVMSDVVVGGQQMHRGDRLVLNWAGANHDPDHFEDPGALDIDRKPNRHMGFGMGAHLCAGIHMARAEMRVAIEEALKRMHNIRLQDPSTIVERPGSTWGLEVLPLRFDPAPVSS
ncbi:MAG: cypA [Frankiales bacterium]|nr:cypA [Frankiales bacterium]